MTSYPFGKGKENIKQLFSEGYDKYDVSEKQISNSRNGYSKKIIKSGLGLLELNIPSDMNSQFEPKILPECQ